MLVSAHCSLSASDPCLLTYVSHKGQIFPAGAHPTYTKLPSSTLSYSTYSKSGQMWVLKKRGETGKACSNALNIYQVAIDLQTRDFLSQLLSLCKSPQRISLP